MDNAQRRIKDHCHLNSTDLQSEGNPLPLIEIEIDNASMAITADRETRKVDGEKIDDLSKARLLPTTLL